MTEGARKRRFLLLLLALFCLMLVMNLLTPLNADDYSNLYRFFTDQRVDSLSTLIASGRTHYHIMNGRIVTNILLSQGLYMAGELACRTLNALAYLAFLLGLYLLVRTEKRFDWALLAVIHAAVFLFAPVFGITVLWLNGAFNYLWGTTLILYALLPFGRAVLTEGGAYPGRGRQALLVLTALLAGNIAENTSLGMMAIMLASILWLLWRKKRVPLSFCAALFAAAAGYALLVLFTSAGLEQKTVRSLGLLIRNFGLCMSHLWAYRYLFYVWLALFLLARRTPGQQGRVALSLLLALGALATNLAMVLPSYYPDRADFGWVTLALAACGVLLPALRSLRAGLPWRVLAACLALAAVIAGLKALPYNYDRYRQSQARIDHVIAQRDAGVRDVVTFGIRSKSRYDVFQDGVSLSGNPDYRPNICFALEYGVDSVAIGDEMY